MIVGKGGHLGKCGLLESVDFWNNNSGVRALPYIARCRSALRSAA